MGGNPNSGKENAEADIAVESKKVEKVLSPVTKRKKDPRSKPPKSSERKSPLPSASPTTPKRQRSLSGSSDESWEESRELGEKSTKPLGGEVGRLAVVGKARTIQIIEPI